MSSRWVNNVFYNELVILNLHVNQRFSSGLAGLSPEAAQHPVHVLGAGGARQPSAFIPFCSLATKLSLLGRNVTDLDFNVCSGFVPTVMQVKPGYTMVLPITKSSPGPALLHT